MFRTVKRNGKVIRKDQFTSRYTPQDVIIKVGPPKPKEDKAKDPAGTGEPGGNDAGPTA